MALAYECELIDLVVGCCGLCHELRPCGGWMWRAFFFFSPYCCLWLRWIWLVAVMVGGCSGCGCGGFFFWLVVAWVVGLWWLWYR